MTTPSKQNTLIHAACLNPENGHFNLWWQATYLMSGLFVITLLLWGIDTRLLDNTSVWAKPLKFESSLILYFITLTLLAAFLPSQARQKFTWQWATRLAVSAGILEILYILIQAARGRASHFNTETPVESMMYNLMGLGAVTLVIISFYLGWLLYRHRHHTQWEIFILASAWGLMLGSILTLITAGVMGGQR